MDDDQQFCLRWNNHQSTLVAVFDTLLENGTLVDCTLAAEGKCLNAHKVVLSACSPYFESLLSRHFDKHPILILKDVKFQELKAMMDYMYRGEVNISQDQLGALLKAAESLQIKGLSDNRKGETTERRAPASAPHQPPKSPPQQQQPTAALPKVQGLTIERREDGGREGSQSPGPRKKKRTRRKSEDLDNHDASNSSESHSLPPANSAAQNIPTLPAASKMNADVPETVETKSDILTRHCKQQQQDDIPQVPIIKEKLETHTELMLEPKSEYVEEMNEDSIEDLTLDDDDLSNMEQMDDGAGPSHGNMGEGSSQGFGGWHMGNQSQDEVFLAAQEAVGAHRDSQGTTAEEPETEEKPKPTKTPMINIIRVQDLKTETIIKPIQEPTPTTSQEEEEPKEIELEQEQFEPEPTQDHQYLEPDNASQSVQVPITTSAQINLQLARKGRLRHANSIERRQRFLNMTRSDLPANVRRKLKCEVDLKQLARPVDTLRCASCAQLYKQEDHLMHQRTCRAKTTRTKFGCTICKFTHYELKELEEHIKTEHKKK